MEQLVLSGEQHRHAITPTRFEGGIGVDIDLVDRNRGRCGERGDLGAHLVAEVAVGAGEQRQPHSFLA
jgi:hypothetical protein